MPYIKSHDIHVTPNRSLRYICDPAKTQGGLNIVSVNCMPDARNAYLDMKQIYEYYAERKFNEHKKKAFDVFVTPFYEITTSIKVKAGAYKNTTPINSTCGRFMRLYQVLVQENITNISEAEDKLTVAEKKYADTLQQVQELKEKISTLESEIKSANHYFDDMGIMQRRFPKKDKDKAAVAVIKEHSFKKKEDISILTEQLEKSQTELVKLNEQLSSSCDEVRKYKAIVDEYYQIFSGESYVDRLVREAKDNITQDDWNNMISEQRKVILEELDTLTNPPMYHLEKQIWDKIVKLRTMNVEPYEVENLIRTLAVMRIDGIQKIEDARKLAARMKNSSSIAQDKSNRRLYERRADDYERILSAVRNIDLYPPERKPSEQKKTPPKKKHRR